MKLYTMWVTVTQDLLFKHGLTTVKATTKQIKLLSFTEMYSRQWLCEDLVLMPPGENIFPQFCGSILQITRHLYALLLTIPRPPSPLFPCSELMHSSLTAPHSWCLSCLLKKVRAKQSCLSAQKSLQVLKKESTVGLCYIIKEESKEQKKRQNSQDGRKEGNVLWKKRGLRKRTGTLHTQHHTVLWPPPWTKTTQD